MEQIILFLHLLLAASLIGLVLLQRGKGASMGAAFGSGASQTVFGSKGSIGFLAKLTIFIAALFFVTSISLTYIAAHRVNPGASQQNLLAHVEQIAKHQKK